MGGNPNHIYEEGGAAMGAATHRRRKNDQANPNAGITTQDDATGGYADMKVVDLDALLEERGLPKTGNKAEKVQRLEDSDQSQDATQDDATGTDPAPDDADGPTEDGDE